ncbi:DUF362 domain-containing protein [bacterium]|nr:DUF362 domain-containing protein [bacterium]
MNRRHFIQSSSGGLLGAAWLSRLFGRQVSLSDDRSRVIVIRDEAILDDHNQIQAERAQNMVDAGIRSFTGIDDIGEAWKSCFPEIGPHHVIGIKINCLFTLASHPEVAYAIAGGLQQMRTDGVPFPANNIIIWDRSDWDIRQRGYTVNGGDTGVRCMGTDHAGIGYHVQNHSVSGRNQKISRILTDMCDYLINLSVLKNHSMAEVTFSLKNHYGTCNDPGSLHDNWCNPYIPALNSLQPIRDKQVLCICDAIFGVHTGGPDGYPKVTPKRLVFSQDPVAHDTVCLDILNEYRNNPLSMPRHIATAASAPYLLGTNNRDQIDRLEFDAGSPASVSRHVPAPEHPVLWQNYPNPFNSHTVLSYRLGRSENVRITIYDIRGKTVQELFQGYQEKGTHQLKWDGSDRLGKMVGSGTYVCTISTDLTIQSIRMQLEK